jgi:hypothetical protein
MDKSIRPPLSRVRPGTNAIPYTKYALERDLERVQGAWEECQADRRRDAIYGYLKAVYDLVYWWSAEKCEVERTRQALRLRGLLPLPREDVFAAIIRCTADPARVDKRTRSKSSRALRYVKMQKAAGDQSRLFNAVRQVSEQRCFGGFGLDFKCVRGAGAHTETRPDQRGGRLTANKLLYPVSRCSETWVSFWVRMDFHLDCCVNLNRGFNPGER